VKQRTRRHPLFGQIPLIERHSPEGSGRDYVWDEYDPDYKPNLPAGAVKGDVRRQSYCCAHHVPKYFYVDENKTCVQCGSDFVFTAREQKFWYERMQFNFSSTAIRCRTCRKLRRTESALRQQIAQVLEALKLRPDDPHHLIELASATVMYSERTGEGDLNRAIAACRAARSKEDRSSESLFWEGRCQQLAGRMGKARECLALFLSKARKVHRLKKLISEADAIIALLSGRTEA
jgi:hypothetical protein